ncbi:MAG: histidine kinase [Cryomorphaceae bacterium]|nr:histidine kinase [Cryomorphaceae bacterium]
MRSIIKRIFVNLLKPLPLIFTYLMGLILLGYINHGSEYEGVGDVIYLELALFFLFAILTHFTFIGVSRFFLKKYQNNYLSYQRIIWEYLATMGAILLLFSLTYVLPVAAVNLSFSFSDVLRLRFRQTYIFIFLLSSLIFFVRTGYQSYVFLKEEALRRERILREQASQQFETLKSQINPHFLFNCLSVLSMLIMKDKTLAANFLDELSFVYRYILESRGKKWVSLQEEAKFLKAYGFILQNRYPKSLELQTDESTWNEDFFVAPLITQLVIEQAIEKSIMTKDEPLRIQLFVKGNKLIMKHLENWKSDMPTYEDWFTPVEVFRENNIFRLEISLLEKESEL